MKYIVLVGVVALVLWLMLGRRRSRPPATPAAAPTATSSRRGLEGMVPCARCGVHLPAGDAVVDEAGHPYCGGAHRDLGPNGR